MTNERRSTFLKKCKDRMQYLSDHCSLPVVGYVISPTPTPLVKRIFWLLTIIACYVCCEKVLRGALNLYTSDMISYSVETDYLEFDTPFPAITICEYVTESKVDTVHVSKYLKERQLSSLLTFIKEVSYHNFKFCKSCITCKVGQSCVEDFEDMVNDIRKKCPELLTKCSWNGETFPCCERFRPMTTEFGTCFTFNSRMTDNQVVYSVNRKTGLPQLTFEAIENVFIRVQSANDTLSVASENILTKCEILPLIAEFDLVVSAEQTISDSSVQALAPSSRDCLFGHERPAFAHLWPFAEYSYSACLLYTRAMVQAEYCNCTHHFMPVIGDIPKCNIKGLACLSMNKGELSVNKYICPMSCDEVTYKLVHVTCPRHIGKVQGNDGHSHGTRGRVQLGSLPTLRVRRQAIRELLGLVVDIGSVVSVFFGASLLSFLEIFYLIFIRKYR